MRLLLSRKDLVGSRLRRSGDIFVAQQKRQTLERAERPSLRMCTARGEGLICERSDARCVPSLGSRSLGSEAQRL